MNLIFLCKVSTLVGIPEYVYDEKYKFELNIWAHYVTSRAIMIQLLILYNLTYYYFGF